MKLSSLFGVPAILLLGISSVSGQAFIQDTIGIGTSAPASRLHITDNSRNYYVNRAIPGQTEDSQGPNYLILHQRYTTTLFGERHVMGKITGVRGSANLGNRKWTVEVNTSSAYNSNRGSIISYNEPTKLVTLTYNGVAYLAVEIANGSTMYGFSFTGYGTNVFFQLVKDQDVSNVETFRPTDPVSVQGVLNIGGAATAGSLNVHANPSLRIARFTQGETVPVNSYLEIANGTTAAGYFYPGIVGRSNTPARPLGIFIQGEADDSEPIGADNRFAAVVLDGRNKTGAILANNNILAVNSAGTNYLLLKADGSLGIGTQATYGHKLAVNGSGIFTKVTVKAYNNWPDYVFHDDYQLPSLYDVEQYIRQNCHLPDIPEEAKVKQEGIDLGEMDSKLLRKIEELMLYAIRQQKQIDRLLKANKELKEEVEKIKNRRN